MPVAILDTDGNVHLRDAVHSLPKVYAANGRSLTATIGPGAWARTAMTPHAPLRPPINRKERYYTGTVLPMIVASDNRLHLLLKLCGLGDVTLGAVTGDTLQFFTEYSFA